VYAGDGARDHTGADRCANCGLPKTHRRHELPPTPDAAATLDARRAGELEETR
jgi:hypothetical protein